MALSPGTRVGPYEITGSLGEGGMGEVYQAKDARLGRDVAIKVLPPAFTDSAERLARFEREARVLASLSHPNIAAIYGLEESEGSRALVMELIPGPTLADRLVQGPLPLDEIISVFRQIAEGLESAHAQGIVHRDLKPQNIKLRPDGTVKVLDFGLAKATDPAGEGSSGTDLAKSPTMTTPAATVMGVILGSAAYMAPEQAKGKVVDKRADIWAFGVLLHECLAGKPLFEGETVPEILAAVLRQEIDDRALPPGTPAGMRRLLRRCLERDPRNRLHDIADARIALDEIAAGKDEIVQAAAPVQVRRKNPLPWIAVAFLAGALATAAAFSLLRGTKPPSGLVPVSFQQLTLLSGGERLPAISPDGQTFAYVKDVGDHTDIFVQRVDGRTSLDVTTGCAEDDQDPAFSPDGRLIAFRSECSGGGVFVMGATGESVRKVTDFGFSPAWSPDGRELAVVTESLGLPWARASTSELWAIRVDNGEKRRVSQHDAMQPAWSPDGRRIAFWGLRATTSQRDLWSVAADGSESSPDAAIAATEDPDLDWSPVWSADGRSLYYSSSRGGTMNLWRLPVYPSTGRAAGAPVPLTAPSSWVGWISLSADGKKLVWVDRNARTAIWRAPYDPVRGELTGSPQQVPLGSIELYAETFDLSGDGGSILFSNAGLPQHLFLIGADGTGLRQLTDGSYRDRQGFFSPDGKWIAFQTTRWPCQVALIRPDGSGLRAVVSDRTDGWFPTWSPDGKRLALSSTTAPYLLNPDAPAAEGSTEPLPNPKNGTDFNPSCWSTDGRLLVGSMRDPSTRTVGVAIYDVSDKSYRTVSTEPDASGCQFLDGNRRLLCAWPRRIVVRDLQSDAVREVWAAPPGREIASAATSGDGRWLAWVEAGDESDIWMATLAPAPE